MFTKNISCCNACHNHDNANACRFLYITIMCSNKWMHLFSKTKRIFKYCDNARLRARIRYKLSYSYPINSEVPNRHKMLNQCWFLVQSRRRRANVEPALIQRLVSAGYAFDV